MAGVSAILTSLVNVSNVTCEVHGEDVFCNGTKYSPFESDLLKPSDPDFLIYSLVCAALVLSAGVFSGLTLGLLTLDINNLNVIIEGGTEEDRIRAIKIKPLVEKHHLLLVTLLLANASVCEALPLFLDKLVTEYVAIAISVTAVLMFGEVIPQALCSKYGLKIGAFFAPFVWLMMVFLFPIAYPISKLLDLLLGEHESAYFRRAELGALVKMHGEADNVESLTIDEIEIIRGALELNDKTAEDAMQPIESVFSLPFSEKLTGVVMDKILNVGHSRIPVWQSDPEQMAHYVLTKALIKFRPEDGMPISEVPKRQLVNVSKETGLYSLLNIFKSGRAHLAAVRDEDLGKVVGIITLEDVIEELLQQEIVDETDQYVDVHKHILVSRLRKSTARVSRQASLSQSIPMSRGRVLQELDNSINSERAPLLAADSSA